ncbi:MAG: asparagine synthase (glutamine-hydrolyzing) [Calditrichaeota bacterium]|nr:MAG: asparagine synthase (glutamine-hydrolyzing) [Calditrichota bacterium]
MCGIAGYFQLSEQSKPDIDLIGKMTHQLNHRGPDEYGLYFDNRAVLGHARLSIIDLTTGQQPLTNEDSSIWISFNGEIYNYIELRADLEKAGHKFRTTSDTEVIVHAYEEFGYDCVKKFNGQFSFCIYDKNKSSLFISRDRLGIRPLFYTVHNGRFYFASEIKAMFADNRIPREIDLEALDQIFTWWTSAPPKTIFKGINELPAGSSLIVKDGQLRTEKYWELSYPETFDYSRSIDSWAEEMRARLIESVRFRLRADVPVGAYLSGGLDSSVTTALIKNFTNTKVETFSVAFEDKAFDESIYQTQMSEYLGTNHHVVKCDYHDIAENFPKVIWHTEKPIVRTAPTPLMLLSGLVRQNNFKVVLTGEGSDEIIGGYDIFKETLIRKFWAKHPDSKFRPIALRKLYPTLPVSQAETGAYLGEFYKSGFSEIDKYYFSHIPRMNTTTKIKMFFTPEIKEEMKKYSPISAFESDIPKLFANWHHLSKAQYVEARSLLAGYILSSQGDRMGCANSVEGRFPFLDHTFVEFCSNIPPGHKIFGLNEKYVLKKAMEKELPKEITNRVKQPYMAPDSNSFVQPDSPDYVQELLSESSLEKAGLFNPQAVKRLVTKCTKSVDKHLSFKDNMSFVSILSTQILSDRFLNNFKQAKPLKRSDYKTYIDQSS